LLEEQDFTNLAVPLKEATKLFLLTLTRLYLASLEKSPLSLEELPVSVKLPVRLFIELELKFTP